MEPRFVVHLVVLASCFQHGVAVFLSGPAANVVLQRHKRYNTGLFEEFKEGNLERECVEEVCSMEEVREVFEDDQKTMDFWTTYSDGDQCKSDPCLNGGSCTDQLGFYTCSCPPGYTGRNCDILVAKRCDVNNGECWHFCESMETLGAKCSCAQGYKLSQDGTTCEPKGDFPCGRNALVDASVRLSRSLLHETNATSTSNDTVSSTYDEPGKEAPETLKRIIGGENVSPGEIPWQVALVAQPSGQFFCGGTIVSERWVITAAHCLVKKVFLVRAGVLSINTNEEKQQDHEVMEKFPHPNYNNSISLYDHDIALLYLSTPFNFSTTVRPICLGPQAFIERLVKVASSSTISGWGRTHYLGARSENLLKVDVPYTTRAECKRSSSYRVTPYMFCAGYYDEKKDACKGDSGGPHATSIHDTWFLTGIISWGEECAGEGKYGVYTRMSLYYTWIKYVMGIIKHRVAAVEDQPED